MAPNGQWLYWCEVEFSLLDRSVSLRTETMEKFADTQPGLCGGSEKLRFLPHLSYKTLAYLNQVKISSSWSAGPLDGLKHDLLPECHWIYSL